MRDHTKLKVFALADEAVVLVYAATRDFPSDERHGGLCSQIRRASVSVPANIVEGAGKDSDREYARYVTIAHGSASEARYLIDLSFRLGFILRSDRDVLYDRYEEICRGLAGFLRALRAEP